ncbi:MAG: N-acetyltransferase, partial [Candidatus Eisenbacteria bacterium]|nr:N-acetyltransferase [Candidatus Eisenbacteria bacterium]
AFSTIEDRVFIAPGVCTSNDNYIGRTEERFKHFKGVTVKRGGRIGVGSVILPGVTIHEDGVVAAGSVVTRDVPARMIVLGSPAKVLRPVPKEQLLENQDWPDVRETASTGSND